MIIPSVGNPIFRARGGDGPENRREMCRVLSFCLLLRAFPFETDIFFEKVYLFDVICGEPLLICSFGFVLFRMQSGRKRGLRESLKKESGNFGGNKRLFSGMFPATCRGKLWILRGESENLCARSEDSNPFLESSERGGCFSFVKESVPDWRKFTGCVSVNVTIMCLSVVQIVYCVLNWRQKKNAFFGCLKFLVFLCYA